MAMNGKIRWTPEGLQAVDKLQQLLTSSRCLGLPDHSKSFNPFFGENVPTVHVHQAVHALISQTPTAHFTPARLLHYQNVLLTMSHVT